MIAVEGPGTMATSQVKDRPSTPETLPGTVSSCSLEEIAANHHHHHGAVVAAEENREEEPASPTPPRSAPSSVCQQRKLSAAIVTTPEASQHDFVAGRPTMTVEDLTSTNDKRNNSNNNMSTGHLNFSASKTSDLVFDTPPPKPKHSGHRHRGVSTGISKRNSRNRDLESGGDNGSSSSLVHRSLTRQSSTPAYSNYASLKNEPHHPLRVEAWAEPPATAFNIRGPSYLSDNTKQPSEESLFTLLSVDIVRTDTQKAIYAGLCNHPNERIQCAIRREQKTGIKELPDFVFAINLAVPGPPFYHVMIYMGCDDIEALRDTDTPFGRLARPFFFGASDEFRDNTFKLIPRIVDGNFVVRKAVGSKPTILGRKLKQHYIRDPRFLELIVDIGSDSIAKKVVALSMGYAKAIVVDMMFLLEGNTEETLPERIMGGVRLKNLDFKKRDGTRVCSNYKK